MAVCSLLFCITWALSSRIPFVARQFRKFDFKNKVDWTSRIPSVIHANLVLYFLLQELLYNLNFDTYFQTTDDLSVLERNLCISAGYFMYDFVLVAWSRMDLWQLFIFHHCAALWPLIAVLFGGCQNYTFFGASFFLVEMTILPLQFVHWCETLKRPDHWLCKLGFHLTFWLWIPFRFILPPWLVYQCIFRVMAIDDSVGLWQCKISVGQGGVSIWAFCWLIFFMHILPGYWKRAVKGGKPNQHPAPAAEEAKEAAAKSIKRAARPTQQLQRQESSESPSTPSKGAKGGQKKKNAAGSPMSPVMSPTFKSGS